ncbi:MAG TPA: hypothetical protein DCZ94_08610 [Lentisphaeria bacterium]|nr:MAG: hypothetical protein A2X48_12375 [Lentisphaerae bacterium GWF2_49_21]HBC87000.1 hypothetical protein [Lentisphaeria bacterium]
MDPQKNKKSSLNAPALILCAVIIAVTGVSYIRQKQEKIFPQQAPKGSRDDAARWCESVEKGEMKKAETYAARICGGCDMKQIPDVDYLRLAEEMKFSTLLFNQPFGKYDFYRWKDACAVLDLVWDKKTRRELQNMVQGVIDKLECRPTPEGKPQSLTISEILQRGYGNTHEITRVLCEAAYQSGYDVMAVSIFDESKNLIHVVCEIRGKDKSLVVDTRFKKIWDNMTFAKLAEEPKLTSGTWPENIAKSVKFHIYNLPAEFQDYKVYNQNLQQALSTRKIDGIPRFGEDPRTRIEKYLKYFGPDQKPLVTYWRYPFIALLSQPDFPAGWRLNYEKFLEEQ